MGAANFFGGLARKASYSAGMLGGLLHMFVGPSHHSWRRGRREQIASGCGDLVHRTGGFRSLRTTLLGSSKPEVISALGAPQAAAVNNQGPGNASAAVLSPQSAFWVTNTWYYPFDAERRAAIAVQFRRGRVVGVEFISGF